MRSGGDSAHLAEPMKRTWAVRLNMRISRSGKREASQALGTWLQNVMAADVAEVRWQSGFFAADSLGIVQSALNDMAGKDRPVHALIGSNDQCTIRRDVERLVSVLGIPRNKAQLGVVSYQDGYYHPKTFHVRRADEVRPPM